MVAESGCAAGRPQALRVAGLGAVRRTEEGPGAIAGRRCRGGGASAGCRGPPMTSMRAAVLVGPRRVEVREVPVPAPAAEEVRVRLEGCGVCASNLPPWEGREWFTYPMAPGALGHEGWGRIEAVGAGVSRVAVGDRVAMLSDRAYAEYDVAAEAAVVRLPAFLEGQPFPGEPLGCALNIFRRSEIRKGQTVAVVGIGF